MNFFTQKAEKFAEKFTSKTGKILAFWGAITGLVAMFPVIGAFLYSLWIFAYNVYNYNNYVEKFTKVTEYLVFQVGQNTRMINAEADAKVSFGVPVRMTNPPKKNGVPTGQGDLWYTTYIKITDEWYIITYKAQPYMSDGKVHFFDYHKTWKENVNDLPKPNKNDIKAN